MKVEYKLIRESKNNQARLGKPALPWPPVPPWAWGSRWVWAWPWASGSPAASP